MGWVKGIYYLIGLNKYNDYVKTNGKPLNSFLDVLRKIILLYLTACEEWKRHIDNEGSLIKVLLQ